MPEVQADPVRSREWEEFFLDGAARRAGIAPDLWTPEVRDRMDAAERQYGNTWATRPMRELVAEMDEEGMDLGGWSALVGQRLYTDKDPEVISAVLTRLREVAALGARERLLRLEIDGLLGLG